MDLADLLHTFGRRTEAREMELWGWVQETLRTQEVHQLVSRVKTAMQEASAQFAQGMYQHVENEVAKLADDLAALGTDLEDLQKHQVSGEQLQDLATSGQVQAVEDRVTQMETAHRQYVDQTVAAARTKLQAEINGKTVMIKAEVQQQLNELKASIGATLQEMKGQVAEVQKSQDKMWGAISRMGEELRELATREDSSDEEQEAGPEVSQEETAPTWIPCVAPEASRTVTSPIPPLVFRQRRLQCPSGLWMMPVYGTRSALLCPSGQRPQSRKTGYLWRTASLRRLPWRKKGNSWTQWLDRRRRMWTSRRLSVERMYLWWINRQIWPRPLQGALRP